MLDFISEHALLFIIIGAVIVLTVIGYIVDKFVINKNNDNKKQKETPEIQENHVEPILDNQEALEKVEEVELPEQEVDTAQESEVSAVELTDNTVLESDTLQENVNMEVNENEVSNEENNISEEEKSLNDNENDDNRSPWEV